MTPFSGFIIGVTLTSMFFAAFLVWVFGCHIQIISRWRARWLETKEELEAVDAAYQAARMTLRDRDRRTA